MAARELKFDIDKIKSMSKKLEDTADDLNKTRNDTIQAIGELKTNWNTTAGKKFFSEVDTDWSSEVDNYIKLIKAVKELLDTASTKYALVEEAIDNIKF